MLRIEKQDKIVEFAKFIRPVCKNRPELIKLVALNFKISESTVSLYLTEAKYKTGFPRGLKTLEQRENVRAGMKKFWADVKSGKRPVPDHFKMTTGKVLLDVLKNEGPMFIDELKISIRPSLANLRYSGRVKRFSLGMKHFKGLKRTSRVIYYLPGDGQKAWEKVKKRFPLDSTMNKRRILLCLGIGFKLGNNGRYIDENGDAI